MGSKITGAKKQVADEEGIDPSSNGVSFSPVLPSTELTSISLTSSSGVCNCKSTGASENTRRADEDEAAAAAAMLLLAVRREAVAAPFAAAAGAPLLQPQPGNVKARTWERHQFDLPRGRHNGNVHWILLVVGAGILAIPAVTQEAGFLASAVTCILCWIYMVVTGLLVAEVNVNTMCELGSGGALGVRTASFSYLFIHYALLVAYVARSSEIMTNSLGIPLWESATLFSLAFGGLCYFGSQRVIGAVNGFLVISILASFTTLVVVACGNLQWSSLLEANYAAAPQSIPIIALSFVYQNVVPVLCTNLEGDLSKVRKAIVVGTAIPLALFLIWDAVILGTIPGLAESGTIIDPLEQLRSTYR
ncbi:hypothetical protein GUJ93_ZPchr0007g4202 [Zizania palustris]|uniref:Uncharacterized protein n=1 Tax=Zizania palustris TaxID=103762 RepID=A0A8J5T4A8_ZIZPA|nr:hypothetical protein GUJ93_ZPchr0007g4202 [Zizania palustris]